MIIKYNNGNWETIGDWCNNQQFIKKQYPKKCKLSDSGATLEDEFGIPFPSEDNEGFVDIFEQGKKCSICDECGNCYILESYPIDYTGNLNHYNITVNNKNATIDGLNSYGINFLNQRELDSISKWFLNNDWKINKIIIGEWEKTDQRWIDYLAEREIKRARQDQLLESKNG